jgi:hypothetical protein
MALNPTLTYRALLELGRDLTVLKGFGPSRRRELRLFSPGYWSRLTDERA